MKLISPAKLTLSLGVSGRRDDGYHSIDAEMVSLDFADTLEVKESDTTVIEVVNGSGADFDGAVGSGAVGNFAGKEAADLVEGNLVAAALELVGRAAHVKINKVIAPGAGLGGGSSNAAAILRWAWGAGINKGEATPSQETKSQEPPSKIELPIPPAQIATQLGADVVFCLTGGRAKVSGMGEEVQPLDFVAETYTLLTPPFGCSTAEVYKIFDELGELKATNGNDLEFAALSAYPELAFWCEQLGEVSGKTPRLAGSGSTWFVEGEYEGDGLVVARTLKAH